MSNVSNANSWTFSDDMHIKYGVTSEFDQLPTPDKNDTYFRGEPLAFYNMEDGSLFLYDYISQTWIEQ